MTIHAPRRPGGYRLTGRADDVLAALVDAHARGQLAAVTAPRRARGGRVTTCVRIGPRRRRVRPAVLLPLAAVAAFAVAFLTGAVAAWWSPAAGAVLSVALAVTRVVTRRVRGG